MPFLLLAAVVLYFISQQKLNPTSEEGGDMSQTDTWKQTHPDIIAWHAKAEADLGMSIGIVSTTRSLAEQADIYSWGRTTQNPYSPSTAENPLGITATNAMPGQTAHNPRSDGYSHAVDFKPGNMTVFDYTAMGAHAEANGLVWGGRFLVSGKPDYAHIETKFWRNVKP